MSNLLPGAAQKNLWSAYRARLILAGAIVFIAAAGVACLAIVPGYAVFAFVSGQRSDVVLPQNALSAEESADVIRTQAVIAELAPLFSATTTPTIAVAAALGELPRGVKIDHLTYVAGSPATLMLVGVADTREGINAYRDALAANSLFRTVAVPVGALVGAKGGRFTMTLTGTF